MVTYIPKTARLQTVEDELVARDTALQILKDKLVLAQERVRRMADKHRADWVFEEGISFS